jgi:hypothetical protein
MTRNPPAPLYTDPVHQAPTDPTLIEGPDGRWWMFYTQRRAGDTRPGVTWIHGTDIATAYSTDGGLTWTYNGVVEGLDPNAGRNTLWAPEVIFAEGRFHMFVTYIVGVPSRWSGHDRHILHHVSDDLHHWDYLGEIPLSSSRVIDAAVHPRPGGGYRMWFKDEAQHSWTWAADSDDLLSWGPSVPVITGPEHEGPNVFELGGTLWMIVDEWHGLAVYTSADLNRWERQGLLLDQPGSRLLDHSVGRHADVVVGRDADDVDVAWIFYFTDRLDDLQQPGSDPAVTTHDANAHRTDIQVAEMRAVHGRLTCDRDAPFSLDLRRASRFTRDAMSRVGTQAGPGVSAHE